MKMDAIVTRAALVAIAGTAALQSAAQQQPADDALQSEIRGLDVAGVYWGQSETDMTRALATRGFSITERMGRGNFDWEVGNEARKRTGGAWEQSDGVGTRIHVSATKGSESIQVILALSPSGPRVREASYTLAGDTEDVVEKAAAEKYGPRGYALSPVHMPYGRRYCLKRDALCTRDTYATYPNVFAGDGIVRLEGGQTGDATFDEAFEKAVLARIGPRRPSF